MNTSVVKRQPPIATLLNFLVAAFLFFGAQNAHALITITSVDRASVVENSTSTAGVARTTIYGGIAGPTSRCDVANSTTQTCDNCRLLATDAAAGGDANLIPCNTHRINPNLLLAITFSSDATAGTTAVTSSDGNTALTGGSTSIAVAKGTAVTVTIPWSSICTRIFADANDTGDGAQCIPASGKVSGVIRVGITPGSTGLLNATTDDVRNINVVVRSLATDGTSSLGENCASAGSTWQVCYFEMGPGDGKAVLKTLLGPSTLSFPATDYKYVRVLYSPINFSNISLASDHQDLPVSASDTSSFSVSPRRIEGLTNDTTYYFKTALVDVAGNVGLYSKANHDADCSNAALPTSTCRQATPSEVVGVLDKTNCFIATAAYGTQFAEELDTLRDFRDQILMRTGVGRAFIHFYYEKSPYYARLILQSPTARATVRTALVPVVWFAGMTLAYGPLKAGLAFLASLILVAAMVQLGRRPAIRAAAREKYNEVKDRARRSLIPLFLAAILIPLGSHEARAAKYYKMPRSIAQEENAAQDADSDAAKDAGEDFDQPFPEDELSTGTSSLDPLPEEVPPEPEYPYPGAKGNTSGQVTETRPTPAPRPVARPSPLERADQKFGTNQRPTAITEDGEYIYEKLPDQPKKYGPAKTHKFSNRRGAEKPSTISSDGEFTYPVEESPFTGAAGIRFGMLAPPSIVNSSNGLNFKQIYGEADIPGLMVEYEYPLTRAIGRIGLKFETGAYYAQAYGRFLRPARADEIPEERFTFLMVPIQALIHYRFQYADKQLVVPFVEGGGGYNGIAELRDDNKKPRFGGAPVLIASGGVNILLDWMDQHAIRQLDAEYGINHVWLTVQYRQIVGLKKDVDFSTHLISGGFTFDF